MAPVQPLAWEPPYATNVTLKKRKKKKIHESNDHVGVLLPLELLTVQDSVLSFHHGSRAESSDIFPGRPAFQASFRSCKGCVGSDDGA